MGCRQARWFVVGSSVFFLTSVPVPDLVHWAFEESHECLGSDLVNRERIQVWGRGHCPSAIANKSESGSHCDGHPPSTGLCQFGGLIGCVWSFPRSSSPTPRVLQRVPRVSPGCEEPDLEDGSFSSTLGRLLCVACCALVPRAVPLSQLLVDTPVPVDNVCRPRVGSWTLGLLLWQVASVHRVARPECS